MIFTGYLSPIETIVLQTANQGTDHWERGQLSNPKINMWINVDYIMAYIYIYLGLENVRLYNI